MALIIKKLARRIKRSHVFGENMTVSAALERGVLDELVDESGNSTATRAYANPRIAINLSVWENVEALERFVYLTVHKRFYGRRSEWFEHFDGPYFVMGGCLARLDHLKQHGTSGYAFDWQTASAQLWKTE